MAVSEPVFKIPSNIPQDLALILDFVDPPTSAHSEAGNEKAVYEDDISSSGSESEEEVEEVEAEIFRESENAELVARYVLDQRHEAFKLILYQ